MIMWGIVGLVLIGAGWIPQVIEIIKTKHSNLNLGFASLYTFGSLALTVHAINLKDLSFLILNVFALFMGSISLYYTIISKGKRSKSR